MVVVKAWFICLYSKEDFFLMNLRDKEVLGILEKVRVTFLVKRLYVLSFIYKVEVNDLFKFFFLEGILGYWVFCIYF